MKDTKSGWLGSLGYKWFAMVLAGIAAGHGVRAGSPPPEGAEVVVWAVPAVQKVRPDDRVERQNLVWSAAERTIRVSGAANEHVPFQVVITVPPPSRPREEAPMGGFWVEASDLVSTSGRISSENARIYLEFPVLVYGKSSPIGDTGFWPDALVPLQSPFDMGAPFRQAVRNRPVWIDILIPAGTAPGNYQGSLTLSREGRQLAGLSVALEVFAFQLPEETHLLAYMGVSENWMRRAGTAEESRRELLRYHAFLFQNRMEPWFSPLLQPEIRLGPGGEVSLVFDEEMYDLYLEKWRSKRVVLEAVPRGLLEGVEEDPSDPETQRRVQSYVSQVVARFKGKGWADRLVFNSPIDEPNTAREYELTRQWANLVHRAAPGARFLVTESPVPDDPQWGELIGFANSFSVHGNQLNHPVVKETIRDQQSFGTEITWYISCDQVYPQPNYFIDAPAMDPVMVPWITHRYGMNGILYWAINFWSQTADPWLNPVTYLSGFLCSDGGVLNGEGSLVYPGERAGSHTRQGNLEGPVSSIRFELLREGIEDYEYLWLLESLGDQGFARHISESMVVDVSAFSRNVEELYRARAAMAKRIVELYGR